MPLSALSQKVILLKEIIFSNTKYPEGLESSGFFLIIIAIEKMRYLAVFLVGNDSIQVYVLDAAENIRLDLRVALL